MTTGWKKPFFYCTYKCCCLWAAVTDKTFICFYLHKYHDSISLKYNCGGIYPNPSHKLYIKIYLANPKQRQDEEVLTSWGKQTQDLNPSLLQGRQWCYHYSIHLSWSLSLCSSIFHSKQCWWVFNPYSTVQDRFSYKATGEYAEVLKCTAHRHTQIQTHCKHMCTRPLGWLADWIQIQRRLLLCSYVSFLVLLLFLFPFLSLSHHLLSVSLSYPPSLISPWQPQNAAELPQLLYRLM